VRARVFLTAIAAAACGDNLEPGVDAAPTPPTLELVGHSDLGARGMNSALAAAGDVVYVGSRVDGQGHDAGVLIVDITDPKTPAVVGEIGPPEEGLPGMSSRELRAVPDLDLLVVLNLACSASLHGCMGVRPEPENIRLYDISDRRNPVLVGRHDVLSTLFDELSPHEMFLWRDPQRPSRVLLFLSTPPGPPSLRVLDISNPAEPTLLATYDPVEAGAVPSPRSGFNLLHSIGVSRDGMTGYASHLVGGLALLDLSDFANAVDEPEVRQLTALDAVADWSPPEPAGPHSAVEVPGRGLLLATDEVYPPGFGAGCPWGWVHLVDIADPKAPRVMGELKVPENEAACAADRGPLDVTFTAHNATATANLGFVSWYSAGFQVADLSDPAAPVRLVEFRPEPLPTVAVEDPTLGGEPIMAWSYPVIADGLLYFIDSRNGLYILRYSGPHESEVHEASFAEGNSNL